MPDLDRQVASKPAEHPDADPGVREIFWAARANDNSPATKPAGIFREPTDGMFQTRARCSRVECLMIEGVEPGCGHGCRRRSSLAPGEVMAHPAGKIRFDA